MADGQLNMFLTDKQLANVMVEFKPATNSQRWNDAYPGGISLGSLETCGICAIPRDLAHAALVGQDLDTVYLGWPVEHNIFVLARYSAFLNVAFIVRYNLLEGAEISPKVGLTFFVYRFFRFKECMHAGYSTH
ncbi:hypothetical protein FA15DRAFT_660818 [Coprinopsis marcescibilis]|uniref:Uncharacterized protein n=1 Tax=Coprinopsis marcescibilis TaxID=230819 RepID=A0A5C3KER7_COPMA|nr:hypothetical protein FA15DRAFT_660818 [Coprinopsis marcescibilis]